MGYSSVFDPQCSNKPDKCKRQLLNSERKVRNLTSQVVEESHLGKNTKQNKRPHSNLLAVYPLQGKG